MAVVYWELLNGISFNPVMEPGVFQDGAQIYPKEFMIDTTLQVVHEHDLGWKKVEQTVPEKNAPSSQELVKSSIVSWYQPQAQHFPYGEFIGMSTQKIADGGKSPNPNYQDKTKDEVIDPDIANDPTQQFLSEKKANRAAATSAGLFEGSALSNPMFKRGGQMGSSDFHQTMKNLKAGPSAGSSNIQSRGSTGREYAPVDINMPNVDRNRYSSTARQSGRGHRGTATREIGWAYNYVPRGR